MIIKPNFLILKYDYCRKFFQYFLFDFLISIFNKNSRNAQLLGCGVCIEAGLYSIIERLEGQLDEDTLVEIEEDRKGRNIDEYKF